MGFRMVPLTPSTHMTHAWFRCGNKHLKGSQVYPKGYGRQVSKLHLKFMVRDLACVFILTESGDLGFVVMLERSEILGVEVVKLILRKR